jgi:hypothetical protein
VAGSLRTRWLKTAERRASRTGLVYLSSQWRLAAKNVKQARCGTALRRSALQDATKLLLTRLFDLSCLPLRSHFPLLSFALRTTAPSNRRTRP